MARFILPPITHRSMAADESDVRAETQIADSEGETPSARVLYPIFGAVDADAVEFAVHLASGLGAEVVLVDLVAEPGRHTDEVRHVAAKVLQSEREVGGDVPVRSLLEVTTSPVETTIRLGRQLAATVVVFEEDWPRSLGDLVRPPVPATVARAVGCDAVAVSGGPGTGPISSLLVPVADVADADVLARVATSLARGAGASIDLFHVSTPDSRGESRVDEIGRRFPADVAVETREVQAPSTVDAIVEQTDYYDVTVLGGASTSRLRRLFRTHPADAVRERARNRVLTAWPPGAGGAE